MAARMTGFALVWMLFGGYVAARGFQASDTLQTCVGGLAVLIGLGLLLRIAAARWLALGMLLSFFLFYAARFALHPETTSGLTALLLLYMCFVYWQLRDPDSDDTDSDDPDRAAEPSRGADR